MRGMDAPVLSEAFARRDDRRAPHAHLHGHAHQPIGDGLPRMAMALHREEAQLVALHACSSRCHETIPRIVMQSEPTTCAAMPSDAVPRSPFWRRSTISA